MRAEMPNRRMPEGCSPDIRGLADRLLQQCSSQINDSHLSLRSQNPAYRLVVIFFSFRDIFQAYFTLCQLISAQAALVHKKFFAF